jgi:hypothetical protein
MKPTYVLDGVSNENVVDSHGASGVSWCGMTELGKFSGVKWCGMVWIGVSWCELV